MVCPVCSSEKIVEGRLLLSGTDDGWPTSFFPKGLKLFTLKKSVRLLDGQLFRACGKCGHVWSTLDPEELVGLIKRSGKAEIAGDI